MSCGQVTNFPISTPLADTTDKEMIVYFFPAISLTIDNDCTGLPQSGKKFWKMKNFPGQGKVREINKNDKSCGKVREFQKFSKKMLINRLLEILVSITCKQY